MTFWLSVGMTIGVLLTWAAIGESTAFGIGVLLGTWIVTIIDSWRSGQ